MTYIIGALILWPVVSIIFGVTMGKFLKGRNNV